MISDKLKKHITDLANKHRGERGRHWKLSEKSKKRIGDGHRGEKNYWYGKKFSEEHKRKLRVSHLGKFLGEKSPSWKGGISRGYKEGWFSEKHKKFRILVFLRDSFTCQVCNKIGGYLEAHHIKSWKNYPELRFNISNGITLCRECHKLTNNYSGKNRNGNL